MYKRQLRGNVLITEGLAQARENIEVEISIRRHVLHGRVITEKIFGGDFLDARFIWVDRLECLLLSTAAAMVEAAAVGYFVEELDNRLHVGTKDALRKLVGDARLTREKVAGQFLYCAADSRRRRQQLLARRSLLAEPGVVGAIPEAAILPDELRAAIVLFFSLLDEKQRRLYAGLEALKSGRGGDARLAEFLGLDAGTVARGG